MEVTVKRTRRTMWGLPGVSLLLLAVLQGCPRSAAQNITPSSPTSTTPAAVPGYRTTPVDVTVAVGEPAVFTCGVPADTPELRFTFYRGQTNHSLACPGGHVQDVPQALEGSCRMDADESLAQWTIKGTSFSDNGTKVVCQQGQNPLSPAATLHVYDNGVPYYTLIGCVIGGFFGILLVFGILFIALLRSERFRRIFGGGGDEEDDETEIVTNEEKKL